MKSLLLSLLRFYKIGISPLLGQHCRFYPSCSEYAQLAITEHGALRGSLLAGRRLCAHAMGELEPQQRRSLHVCTGGPLHE